MTISSSSSTPPPPWIKTPLIESAALSKAAGCRVFLKLENLQPAGSFKSRGPGNVVYQHVLRQQQQDKENPNAPRKSLHFFCSSGGNAGLGCVTSATSLGYPSTIVVPLTTKPHVVAQLKAAGATAVIQTGESWFYADKHLRKELLPEASAKGVEAVYVSPFDDELIYEGNSKIIPEIHEQLTIQFSDPSPPDAIICSVGGGGLFTGLQHGLTNPSLSPWPSSSSHQQLPLLLAVETTGAASLHASLSAGHLTPLRTISTIATSLGALQISPAALLMAQKPNARSIVLSDADAALGVCRFADDERMLVEPACGVSLAVCYRPQILKQALSGFSASTDPNDNENEGDNVHQLTRSTKIVVIVCGGTGVTAKTVEEYRERYAEEWTASAAAAAAAAAEDKGGVKRDDVPSSFTTLRTS